MKKLSPKPIDIINAAISEIYGEKVLQLMKMCVGLNKKALDNLLNFADMYCMIPEKYAKAIQLKLVEQADKKEEIQ